MKSKSALLYGRKWGVKLYDVPPTTDDIMIILPSSSTLRLPRLILSESPGGLITRLKALVTLSSRKWEHNIRTVYESLIIEVIVVPGFHPVKEVELMGAHRGPFPGTNGYVGWVK